MRALVVPSAQRLMGSLRDLGYEFPQAVAELVDNSIDAGATEVRIEARFAGEDSWVRVCDDGVGMTERGLEEAMRYGSPAEYRPEALGGFGLGLKTASLSQCRRLYVASRRSQRTRVGVRLWDMDEIASVDDWLLERLAPSEAPSELVEPLNGRAGTVVLWEALDRVMLFQNPFGARAEAALDALREELSQHLAMVFHRFLSGEARRTLPLKLFVNDRELAPWDPFARDEPNTIALPAQALGLELHGVAHKLMVRPFLLPGQHGFSSQAAHQAAAGPRKWNRQQGFYVYRGDRLIQSGGWNRLRTQDEHTKLARIAVDIPRETDEAFGVNVSKMRVTIPAALRSELRALVTAISSRAQGRYRAHPNPRRGGSPTNGPSLVVDDAVGVVAGYVASVQDFIPRARVVEILRAELSDEPARLRRLVNVILSDEWAQAGEGQQPSVTSAASAQGSNGSGRRH